MNMYADIFNDPFLVVRLRAILETYLSSYCFWIDVAKPNGQLCSSSYYSSNYCTKVQKLVEEHINKYLGVLKAFALNFSSVCSTIPPTHLFSITCLSLIYSPLC
jgi:hypothetical protein